MTKKNRKLILGIGINDADYVLQKNEYIIDANGKRKLKVVWVCPYYRTWTSMLRRCYSSKYQNKGASYKDCSVHKNWLIFSNFKKWMSEQDWLGNQLDKDLLVEGNRIYSEDTCVFVSPQINSLLVGEINKKRAYPTGVIFCKKTNKFLSSCANGEGKTVHIGCFDTELEAHLAWRKQKHTLACKLAESQTNPKVKQALVRRFL